MNKYILLTVVIFIILISLSWKRIDHFENNNTSLRVKTRPCEMHLTNDTEMCNKLHMFYTMGNIQLQVAINNMKKLKDPSSKQAYNMLRYIQSKKKHLPINSCKIQIDGLSEIDKSITYESVVDENGTVANESSNTERTTPYTFKSTASFSEYDPVSFKGYCLLDTNYDTDEMSVRMKVNKEYSDIMNTDDMILTSKIQDVDKDSTTYAALKFSNDVYAKILNNPQQFCKKNNANIDIPDKSIFIKITCHLENVSKISGSKVEIVEYLQQDNAFKKINKYGDKPKKPKILELPLPINAIGATDAETTEVAPNTDIKETFANIESDIITNTKSEDAANQKEQEVLEAKPSYSEEVMKKFEETFFGFTYIEDSSLVFSSYTLPVKMFIFDFDICSSVVSYKTIEETTNPYDDEEKTKINFSFTEDLRIAPILIKQKMNILFKDDTKNISEAEDVKVTDNKDDDITNLINDKIDSIQKENDEMKLKIIEYDDALDKTAKNYMNLQESCSNNKDTYNNCIQLANINFGNLYKLITIAKTELSDSIQRNMAMRDSLKAVLEAMKTTTFTIEDMNQDIKNNIRKNKDGSLKDQGVNISYQKFAKYVSSDDCIYFQVA